jgi:alpha-L-fucosidase
MCCLAETDKPERSIPAYLKGHEEEFAKDPRATNLKWFTDAKYGLFLYYSYAADWKHPWFMSREEGWVASRPAYKEPQPEYLYRKPGDFRKYIEFADGQVRELITRFPHVAGIWFDPIMGVYAKPEMYDMENTYRLIRETSPHMLISFKQGATGTEDFMAPERDAKARVGKQYPIAEKVYQLNKDKPREICATMQPHAWGYNQAEDGKHLDVAGVIEILDTAKKMNANLLLNIGPLPDGSFPREDVEVLREVGRRIREGKLSLK